MNLALYPSRVRSSDLLEGRFGFTSRPSIRARQKHISAKPTAPSAGHAVESFASIDANTTRKIARAKKMIAKARHAHGRKIEPYRFGLFKARRHPVEAQNQAIGTTTIRKTTTLV
jgi:hypothetical protein